VILVATALFTHRNIFTSASDVGLGLGVDQDSDSHPPDSAYSYICKALLILASVTLFSVKFFAPTVLPLGWFLGNNRRVRRLPMAPAFVAAA
jgi:hypothetical protein